MQDVWFHILQFTSDEDLIQVSPVNKVLYNLCNDNHLWYLKYEQCYNSYGIQFNVNYKWLYHKRILGDKEGILEHVKQDIRCYIMMSITNHIPWYEHPYYRAQKQYVGCCW